MVRNRVTEYKAALWRRFDALKAEKLNLDMTRGKPCPEQLKLSEPMLRLRATRSRDGIDCRNYGELLGLPEARELCARYLGARPDETLIGGNSSLELMFAVVAAQLRRLHWPDTRQPTMLCVVPGYDRHFVINERLGIKMIPVTMGKDGPNLNEVRHHIKNPDVIGMWCVPKYGNPEDNTYSDAVVHALASMKTAFPAFFIMWDNAYAVHDLTEKTIPLANIFKVAKQYGTDDRIFAFGSFSKVTFAGAGLAFAAMSAKNLAWFKQTYEAQTIGADKLNQLRHVRFLKNMAGIRRHMRKHRHIIAPKFKAADEVLTQELKGKGIARWNRPQGGYFISFYLERGGAKRAVELAAELGVKFTAAGSAYPYRTDPENSHIRIAPTFPSVAEIRKAMEVLAVCAQLSRWEQWPTERVAA